MDGYKKGKVNVTGSDDYDDDYGDEIIRTWFENHLPEYLENCDDADIPDAELKVDKYILLDSEFVSTDDIPDLIPHDYGRNSLIHLYYIYFKNNLQLCPICSRKLQ